MATTEPAIDPSSATSSAEFVDLLRRLRIQSELSYRQIAQRARAQGIALPISTLATALSRETMPRQEVVTAMLLACGCSREELAEWLAARRRIVVGASADGSAAAEDTSGPDAAADPHAMPGKQRPGWLRARVPLWATVVVILAVIAGAAWWVVSGPSSPGEPRTPALSPTPAPSASAWPVRVRPVHADGCLSEHAGNSGYLYVEPCAGAFPAMSLEPAGADAFRIRTEHPEFGPGCMGVDPGSDGDRPSDGYCPDVDHQLFALIEAAGGQLLRNVELDRCLAVRTAAGDLTVVFAACSAGDPHQLFAIDRI
ncbi:MAG: helix-turn-helix domain-containing protein [Hamadaea sp.]|nr:helix-turn-helix domain-containing protein [Hamadaea sp.]